MNEITKLYENAKVEKYPHCCDITCGEPTIRCKDCPDYIEIYPPFTAEKQILLIQWVLDKTDLYLHRHKTDFTYSIASGNYAVNKYKDFKESIAEFINAIWQDLTEEECKQIKEILG